MLISLVLSSLLFGLIVSQQPVPCQSPAQFEARIFDANEEQQFRVEARLSYDSIYRRERIVDEIDRPGQTQFFDIIALFDSKTEFIYNHQARNCTRREITREWRDFGVRPNATFYGEAYVGSSSFPGSGVLTTRWGGNFTTQSNDTIEYHSSWTLRECLPVHRTLFSQKFGISHISFYDVTLGIHDPNRFIPRQECLTEYEWNNRYALFGTNH